MYELTITSMSSWYCMSHYMASPQCVSDSDSRAMSWTTPTLTLILSVEWIEPCNLRFIKSGYPQSQTQAQTTVGFKRIWEWNFHVSSLHLGPETRRCSLSMSTRPITAAESPNIRLMLEPAIQHSESPRINSDYLDEDIPQIHWRRIWSIRVLFCSVWGAQNGQNQLWMDTAK